eukprot:9851131-Alexandrium_andersonii.AAC.1
MESVSNPPHGCRSDLCDPAQEHAVFRVGVDARGDGDIDPGRAGGECHAIRSSGCGPAALCTALQC